MDARLDDITGRRCIRFLSHVSICRSMVASMLTKKTAVALAKDKVNALAEFRKLVAPEDIIEAACRLGAIQRQRKVDMPALVEATIVVVLPTQSTQTTTFA